MDKISNYANKKTKSVEEDRPNFMQRCGADSCPLPGSKVDITKASTGTRFYCTYHFAEPERKHWGWITNGIKRYIKIIEALSFLQNVPSLDFYDGKYDSLLKKFEKLGIDIKQMRPEICRDVKAYLNIRIQPRKEKEAA
ncbi:MAG: hypothetical protein ACPG5W_02900 [Flavobacteriales bacterium]